MKSGAVFLIFIFLALNAPLFARGAADDKVEIQTQNDEWILCITNFDVSALPEEKLPVAAVISGKISERLRTINYRTRISPEYAYYEEYAWANSRSVTAKALATKLEERAGYIFRGEPDWRYRRNIARLDAEIENLRAALAEAESTAPLINREPVFNLTAGNIANLFPAPPASGRENRFCADQKADAFLSGSITDFHGRYYLSVKLYTIFTRSFVWEDSIIFSQNDLETALDEITRRLIITLSGNNPAAVAVKTEPEETLVLINRSFAGRGENSILEYPPGTITVTASAKDHESLTFEMELLPAQLAKININLNPIEYVDMEITGNEGKVYLGALYVGEAPLTLRLPRNQMEFVELQTPDGQKGSVVFRAPDSAEPGRLYLRTSVPLRQGRVDRARRDYYWSWGAVWVTGIAAWISYYSFQTSYVALEYSNSIGPVNQQFYDDTEKMNKIMMGTLIAVGVAALYDVIQMIRYLYIANKSSTPHTRIN